MFDVAPSEMMVIAVVAIVFIGPKDLPRAMRVVGQWVGRGRAVARQFRGAIDDMVRESELAEMEQKWQAENERIMREHADLIGGGAPPPVAALPSADPQPAADPQPPADLQAVGGTAPGADDRRTAVAEPSPSAPARD